MVRSGSNDVVETYVPPSEDLIEVARRNHIKVDFAERVRCYLTLLDLITYNPVSLKIALVPFGAILAY
jgi:hypothetical protein